MVTMKQYKTHRLQRGISYLYGFKSVLIVYVLDFILLGCMVSVHDLNVFWYFVFREVGYIPTNYIQLCSSSGLDQYE